MRINIFNLYMDKDCTPVLVKENSRNYACVQNMSTPESVVAIANEVFNLSKRVEEYMYMVCFNAALKPVGFFEISHGCVNETFARPREILIRALLCGAVSIIMLHNHPSMDTPYPYKQDIVMTTNLMKVCNMIGIVCLDHIIISGNDYCSLKELDKSLFEEKHKHL